MFQIGATEAEPEIRWTRTAAEVEEALSLRERVFCREQGVPAADERDGFDDRALHLLAIANGSRVVGTLRLRRAGGVAKIGRVAVELEWRGRGLAARMLLAALARARDRGCHEARLASQLGAVGLYERAGFVVCSEPFEQAGIAHVWMRRALSPTPEATAADPERTG